jgi:hypothetical protein
VAQPHTLRQILVRIDRAVRELAAANGWQPDDYRLYARFDEGVFIPSLHVLLEARSFPGATEFEQWDLALEFLERKLKDVPELRGVMHFVIRTFEQAEDLGARTIRNSYTPIAELIASTPAA